MTAPAGGGGNAPNPVAQIIATRTVQVGGLALLALLGLKKALPPERFRPLVPLGGAFVTTGLSAYFVATFAPRLPLGAPLLTRLPPHTGPNTVALTFDDGPHPDTTPRILDLLRAHDAKATFFVVGEAVARHPCLVRRIADEGHTLGIHGLRHRTMVLQNGPSILADLRETARRIALAAPGAPPTRLFRPPYGFKTLTLSRAATRSGLQLVAWSLDPRDYDGVSSAADIEAHLGARLRPGDIVLLHERPGTMHTLDALPGILAHIAARGLRCVEIR